MVTFDLGAAQAVGDEPIRHVTACAVCACRQYLIPASGDSAEVQASVKR
jgi:hypothetical protein